MSSLLIILFLKLLSSGVECQHQEDSGLTFMEGDIAIRPDLPSNKGRVVGDAFMMSEDKIWQAGIVPYKIDTSSIADKEHQELIREALEGIQDVATCIKFNEITGSAVGDYVLFRAHGDSNFTGSGCWSYLGRQGGEQVINLETPACMKMEHIQHEVIHSLGGIHEHSRPDRDKYIRILEENVEKGKLSNFNISQWYYDDELKGVGTHGAPYDYYSLMHYPNKAFGINGSRTIEALDYEKADLGSTGEMSLTDIVKLNMQYQCNIKTGIIVEYIHEQLTKDDNNIKASVLETIKNKTEHFEQENNVLQEKIQSQEKRIQVLEEDNNNVKEKLDVLLWVVDTLKKSISDIEQKYDVSINMVKDELEDHEEETKVILSELEARAAEELEYEDTVNELNLLNIKRSCQEYADKGINRSGIFFIDPDGPLNPPDYVRVWCTMEGGTGITEVLHDTENTTNISHCSQPGCYSRNVTYSSSDTQIQALKEISDICSQDIRYDCTLAPLRHPVLHTDYGYWYGADRSKNMHWDDSTDSDNSSHRCACDSKESKCFQSELLANKCNCDALRAVGKFDQGTISNKKLLPVKQLHFGGLEESSQKAQHTLGRLKCKGRRAIQSGSSCEAIRLAGNYKSGFYMVKPGNQTSRMVFCNMTQSLDAKLEVFVESASEELRSVNVQLEQLENKDISIDSSIKSLETEDSAINSSIKSLEDKDSAVDSSLMSLESQDVALDSSIKSLESKYSAIDTSIKSLENRDITLDATIKSLENKGTSLDSSIKSLQNKDATLDYNIKSLENKDIALGSSIKSLESKDSSLDGIIKSLQNKDSAIDSSIKSLENKDGVIYSSIKSLESKDSTIDTRIKSLENEDIAQASQIKSLEDKDSTQASKIKSLENKDTALDSSIKSLENKDFTQASKIKSLENKDTNLDSIIKSLENKDIALDSSIKSLENKGFAIDSSIKSLKNKDTAFDSSIKSLGNKVTAFDSSINTLKNKDTAFDSSIQSLENKDIAFDSSIKSLENKDTAFDSSIKSLENKDTAFDSSIKSLQNKDTAIESSINSLKGKHLDQENMFKSLFQNPSNKILECNSYTSLTDSWRRIDYNSRGSKTQHCDKNLVKKWYRFEGAAGSKLPTAKAPNGRPTVSSMFCATHGTAYMTSSHPMPGDGIVSRKVCFEWNTNDCQWTSTMRVRACYNNDLSIYYVYEIKGHISCHLAYCALE